MWQEMSKETAMEKLGTSEKGLSVAEAAKRREKYGDNTFVSAPKKSILKAFLGQLSDYMVIILIGAAVISAVMSFFSGEKEYIDSIIIMAIVLFNAGMGVVQEFRAEHALEALKKMNSPTVEVIREGQTVVEDTKNLVPGDIISFRAGDFVPADARLIECVKLAVNESALTGETAEIKKNSEHVKEESISQIEAANMVWANTVVTEGRGRAVVVRTGMKTQTGKIAGMILESESPDTPLQIRLAKTGKTLGIAAMVICGIIFLMGLVRKVPAFDMFMTSVSLAVAAIPEGLPAIITVMLAIGVQKMAKKNAVIRKLPAVETLGSATIICSDKTGTLTKNQMTVTDVVGDRNRVLEYLCLCNDDKGATEKALVRAAKDMGIEKEVIDAKYNRVDEIPFNSKRKLMTTVHKTGDRYRVITKGAPDILLNICSVSVTEKQEISGKIKELASQGKRVIGVAYKEVLRPGGKYEENLKFLGLAGLSDPPREGVPEAVKICKRAGITPVMVTGDQVDTAVAIAKQTGIFVPGSKVISGKQLDTIDEKTLDMEIENCRVFARVTPEHKMRIVKAFQRRGEVVAMTGDGVNDAPALKTADIGCSMGKCGTDVAKGAADMVLADDNFVTIVEAIRQGRGIYDNIKKAVHFLLSSNIGEILTIFTAIFFGWDSPLTAIQLLWVNLVTDSLPAIALGLQPPDKDIMCKKPVKKNKGIFADGLGQTICLEGVMIGILAITAFITGIKIFKSLDVARTMAFCTLSISQLVHAFTVESEHSLFSKNAGRNKFMIIAFLICLTFQISAAAFPPAIRVFKTISLLPCQWGIVGGLSMVPVVVSEADKFFGKGK